MSAHRCTEIVVVDDRKKLHTFTRDSESGARWLPSTEPSAQQDRRAGYTRRAGNVPVRQFHPTARARNSRRDQAQVRADYPGAPLTLHLGSGIPAVQFTKLQPIFDGFADAADRGEELPAGIRAVDDAVHVEAAVLRVFITRR